MFQQKENEFIHWNAAANGSLLASFVYLLSAIYKYYMYTYMDVF